MWTHRTSSSQRAVAIRLVVCGWLVTLASLGGGVTPGQERSVPGDPSPLELSSPASVAPDLALLLDRYQRTPTRSRLASVPKMFGDSIGHVTGLALQTTVFSSANVPSAIDIPVGSSGASKVGDHNAALPVDRIYFNFHHFHNAFDATTGTDPMLSSSESVNRYTFGWERTFLEGLWSVELRMPFTETYGLALAGPLPVASGGGNAGNLAIVLKRLVYQADNGVMAAGLVLDTPTGEDTVASIGPTTYTVDNSVMGILPYIGLLQTIDDRHFVQAFLQTDIPLGDNIVHSSDASGTPPPQTLGDFTQPVLLYVDISGGCWLYQDPAAQHITAIAALAEIHYTTTLHHGQSLIGTHNGSNGSESYRFGRRASDSDVVNFTIALDAQLANDWNIRVGGVFPMDANKRFFDAEVAVQATRYY